MPWQQSRLLARPIRSPSFSRRALRGLRADMGDVRSWRRRYRYGEGHTST